ncbi:hypothetical protein C8J56DRAFT_896315 [Mycena floridula]|nr:hypothetical protein C8J56DRAFT_902601 [Mycena floridula]KAJ7580969.1 hypothetical protein C8J56DRAFT_896315 [Mycena floridula]
MSRASLADIFLTASNPNRRFPFWTHLRFLEISQGVVPPFDPAFTTSHGLSAYDLLATRIYVKTFWYDPRPTSSQVLHVGEAIWQEWFNDILVKQILPPLQEILNREEKMEIQYEATQKNEKNRESIMQCTLGSTALQKLQVAMACSIIVEYNSFHDIQHYFFVLETWGMACGSCLVEMGGVQVHTLEECPRIPPKVVPILRRELCHAGLCGACYMPLHADGCQNAHLIAGAVWMICLQTSGYDCLTWLGLDADLILGFGEYRIPGKEKPWENFRQWLGTRYGTGPNSRMAVVYFVLWLDQYLQLPQHQAFWDGDFRDPDITCYYFS